MNARRLLPLLLLSLSLSACKALLPSSEEEVGPRWSRFDEVKASYDRIVPYQTDMSTVRELGFDPYKTANTRILNHAQVVQAVLPQPLPDDGFMPPGIRDCIRAQEACRGYHIEPQHIDHKRVGNFWLDFLNFRRETVTTGWRFGALIVVVNDKVVYKQWSGSPNIHEESTHSNPLGPLQGAGASSGALLK